MKLSQLTTEKDRQQAERIAIKRLQERQRLDRILDTKSRIFGLDTAALDEQVAVKQRAKDAEARREQEFVDMQRKKAEEIGALEREEQEQRRQIEEDTNLYRKLSQDKTFTREYDLNDNDALKKEQPPRISDSDPWLSISGAQKFAGEDLSHAARIQAQKDEQRAFLQRQIEEKRKTKEASKLRDQTISNTIIATAHRQDERLAQDVIRRNELSRANAEFNQRLARERQNQRMSDRVAEEKDNLAEIYNHLSSDMLTESPETATSALGRNRKVQYMYRGMSKAEVDTYRKGQLQQQEEGMRRVSAEQRREQDLQRMESAQQRQSELERRELDRMRKNEERDLTEENQRLAGLQITSEKTRNKQQMENRPTEEFFGQFNTTSR